MQHIAARLITGLILCFGLLFSSASNAAAQTVTSPYGGSYAVDTGHWNGSDGTVIVTYSNFKHANGWVYSGSWFYNGSVNSSNILTGTLTGNWSILGLDLGFGSYNLSYDVVIRFADGMANVTLNYTLPETVVNGVTTPASLQTTSLQLRQQDIIGFLL